MRYIMIFSGLFESPGSARRRPGAGYGVDDGVIRYLGFKGYKKLYCQRAEYEICSMRRHFKTKGVNQ